jgi:hypothetical protein
MGGRGGGAAFSSTSSFLFLDHMKNVCLGAMWKSMQMVRKVGGVVDG